MQKSLIQSDQDELKADVSLIKSREKLKLPLRDFYIDILFNVELLGRIYPLENSCEAFQSCSSY